MRQRPSPLLLPAALTSVLLLAGASGPAAAQVVLPYEVELDYNSDTDPFDYDDNSDGTPEGPYTARYTSDTNVLNLTPNLVYVAPDAPTTFAPIGPFTTSTSGARMVVRPQDDPYLVFQLTIENATETGARTGLIDAPITFTSLTLQLDPFVSPTGQLPYRFLADNEGPATPGFNGTGSPQFNSFSLSADRLRLTFFDAATGPGPLALPPGGTATLFFRMSAPRNPDGDQLGINILPNQGPEIPEPGTLALLAAGLPLLRLRRRHA